LKLSRKPFLRPPAFVAQSPNLQSNDIAVPHRARATQAPIAKGQIALTWFVPKLPQLVTKQPFSMLRHRIILCRFGPNVPTGRSVKYFPRRSKSNEERGRQTFQPSEKRQHLRGLSDRPQGGLL
jgi:hypothetical protein